MSFGGIDVSYLGGQSQPAETPWHPPMAAPGDEPAVDFGFPQVIRPSSLPGFNDCARRQAAKAYPDLITWAGYELRQMSSSAGACVGSGTHAGAAASLEEKMKTGELCPEDVAEDAAIAEFRARVQDEGCTWDDTTPQVKDAERQIRRMVRSYRKSIAPQVVPLLVEERLDSDVGGGWTISGQLDSLSQGEDAALRDLKTGTQQRANIVQYGTYALNFGAHGYPIRRIVEDFVPRVRIKVEQPPPISTEIPVDEAIAEAWSAIVSVKTMVAEFVRRVGTGDLPPHTAFTANPQSPLCSAKWCPAHGTRFCRAHKFAE